MKHYDKVKSPILGLGGISYSFLAAFLSEHAENVTMVEMKDTGHWIAEERPEETIAELVKFFR